MHGRLVIFLNVQTKGLNPIKEVEQVLSRLESKGITQIINTDTNKKIMIPPYISPYQGLSVISNIVRGKSFL